MKKGFTLIELLIVIAVLGILAAGILATIDPFEQFKKARDTNTRNTIVELYNSFIRFNANHGLWPWEASAGCAGGGGCTIPNSTVLSGIIPNIVSTIITDGELKSGFATNIDASVLTSARITALTNVTTGEVETVAVCFLPSSKTIRKDVNTKYNMNGSTNSPACPGNGTTGTCYWCAL